MELAAIAPSGDLLRAIGKEETPPNPSRLIMALRQIGYSFEQAVSDLVDNSINARAATVLIRFICENERIRSVVIADDGVGMDADTLREAMRFGSEQERDPASLGKYGMGLKLASLSHARCLTVLTRQKARADGRRWTIEGIEHGWECERIDQADATLELDAPWGGLNLKHHGTLVVWDDIDKLPIGTRGLKETLRGLQKRLQLHLGLCFHRFLEDRRLRIVLDQQTAGEAEHSIKVEVAALNPFKYSRSGDASYPKVFRVELPGLGAVRAQAHIWPPNSEEPEYKLGNKAAARQGFYFYRNDRLIQAGGWNGVVQHETEPHSSLARVRVDLPIELDTKFGLNVQKSAVLVPTGFEKAVTIAEADDGETFERYRQRAQQVYRRKDIRAERDHPLVPVDGIARQLSEKAKALLAGEGSAVRPAAFEWTDFSNVDVFAIDRDARAILLNRLYRKALLGGARASRIDLPFLKLLLFFLLEEDLDTDRLSAPRKERLEHINALLVQALRHERE
ncbi:MAG: ATP-binding protein [Planctomycetes bacterium]|nr:ATP-binding protein [Planctomycetota bacterium]